MPKRVLSGVIVGRSGDKTVVVRVDRRVKHRLYKKFMLRSKKYQVHDEKNAFKVGDNVKIRECPPISKNKFWEVLKANA
jgi:small subunit ribosomal protein S17